MWFKSKARKKADADREADLQVAKALYEEDLRKAADAPRLHGFNLNDWDYLGYTEISITYSDIKHKEVAQIFFFMLKGNETKRKFVVKAKSLQKEFEQHAWVSGTACLWAANEKEWYQAVTNHPSKYSKERMLTEHACEWDYDKNWWVSTSATKYAAASKSQQDTTKEESPVVAVEDNVLKVNFKKEEHDPTT